MSCRNVNLCLLLVQTLCLYLLRLLDHEDGIKTVPSFVKSVNTHLSVDKAQHPAALEYLTTLLSDLFLIKPTDALISQIYFVKKLYMFRAVPLPIIRSLPPYIRHWYLSCSFDDSFRKGPSSILAVLESWKISASVGFIKKKFVTMHGHTNVKLLSELRIQGVIKKFQDLVTENYNLLLMAKNI
jgi:hypothetical protein